MAQSTASQAGAQALLGSVSRFICCGYGAKSDAEAPVPVHKKIQKATKDEFAGRYVLGRQVMPSCHRGVTVLFATRLSDCQKVVIKSRSQSSFADARHEADWRCTMEAQMNLPKAATLCNLMEVIETPECYHVVMERIWGQDLCDIVIDGRLRVQEVRQILRQVLEAMILLHDAGRIHRDLKLENVMLSRCTQHGGREELRAKIIDFDTVQKWPSDSPKAGVVVGTSTYIAPEGFCGEYSPASDMYAIGVMMYALLAGRLPVSANVFHCRPGERWIVGSPAMERIRYRLKACSIDFEIGALVADEEAVALCKSMLAFDTRSRPSAKEALVHPWFRAPNGSLFARSDGRVPCGRRCGAPKLWKKSVMASPAPDWEESAC